MSKPTIFFSHSSRDRQELVQLKELFLQKTGGSIDVFLSSDGQSIPLGRNWVHRIQEALEQAALMVVFVSPNSLRSNWIFFESGYAYSKNIRVVPVGFLGVDLAALQPPLSLLQGFNIRSEEGLNNLIALANEAFNHLHNSKFTPEEYRAICVSSGILSSKVFGDFGSLINKINIKLTQRDNQLDVDPISAIKRITEVLKDSSVEHTSSDKSIDFHGVSISAPSGISPAALEIMMDPNIADITFPILEKTIRSVRSAGINGISIRLYFVEIVDCLTDQFKITGRIYGSEVKMAGNHHFTRQDIQFHVSHLINFGGHAEGFRQGATYVGMTFLGDVIPLSQIHDTIQYLFELGILFLMHDETAYLNSGYLTLPRIYGHTGMALV